MCVCVSTCVPVCVWLVWHLMLSRLLSQFFNLCNRALSSLMLRAKKNPPPSASFREENTCFFSFSPNSPSMQTALKLPKLPRKSGAFCTLCGRGEETPATENRARAQSDPRLRTTEAPRTHRSIVSSSALSPAGSVCPRHRVRAANRGCAVLCLTTRAKKNTRGEREGESRGLARCRPTRGRSCSASARRCRRC